MLTFLKLVGKNSLFVVAWGLMMAPVIFLLNHFFATTDQPQPVEIKILYEVCVVGTILLASFIAARFLDKRPFVSLGFEKRHLFRDSSVGIVVGFVMVILCILILIVLNYVRFDFSRPVELMTLLGFAVLIYLNAITQEVLVRGYPLQSVERQYGTVVAVLVSSVFFAVLHIGGITLANGLVGLIPLLNLFLAGVLLGLAYTRTRKLWLPFAIHYAWNFTQGPLLGLAGSGPRHHKWQLVDLSGPSFVSGGEFGLEGGLVATLVTLLAIAALYLPPINRITCQKGLPANDA